MLRQRSAFPPYEGEDESYDASVMFGTGAGTGAPCCPCVAKWYHMVPSHQHMGCHLGLLPLGSRDLCLLYPDPPFCSIFSQSCPQASLFFPPPFPAWAQRRGVQSTSIFQRQAAAEPESQNPGVSLAFLFLECLSF